MSTFALTNDPVLQQVVGIIAQELEVNQEAFTLTGHFVDDYDADSLSLITVLARIEKEAGIVIPKTELAKMETLENVFDLVGAYRSPEVLSA
ncbi:MAG: acyl carrier protein [Pseudonocardiaceae bacterium]